MSRFILSTLLALLSITACAGPGAITGTVSCNGKLIAAANVHLANTLFTAKTTADGSFRLENIPAGEYILIASAVSCNNVIVSLNVEDDKTINLNLKLDSLVHNLTEIEVSTDKGGALEKLRNIDGTSIFAGKKSEVVQIEKLVANTATNNSRQVYSRIAGLNIWESDAAGLQLGIGGRGLNPNRVSNFNTRQNGYDISADALGYPESYYTPGVDAVDRIEIVRGASSLQYGSQFGGVINFRMKSPAKEKLAVEAKLSAGSYGFYSAFTSLSGTSGKLSWYGFYQFKAAGGWRPNSHFDAHNSFIHLNYLMNRKLSLSMEYSYMNYLAQQPGGLTDVMFKQDPSQSVRSRNYFRVNWNLFALIADYEPSKRIAVNTKFFGLLASKDALGVLSQINRADHMKERDLWSDHFRNIGNETRFLYSYKLFQRNTSLLIGSRTYRGETNRQQGLGNSGNTGKRSDFRFQSEGDLEHSEYTFPGFNQAFFAENIFTVNEKFSIIPGLRYEYIDTRADGYYNLVNYDLAGNVIYKEKIDEEKRSKRSILLAGFGITWNPFKCLEVYSNISRNYRSINFNDIRVANPNLRVDPNLKDEKGYSADAGIRGSCSHWFTYDVSAFYLRYNKRIGSVLMADTQTFNTYRYRTNISDSRNIGVEAYAEIDFLKLAQGRSSKHSLSLFVNSSFIDARYVSSRESSFNDKLVEMVPSVIFRSGLTYRYTKQFAVSILYSHTGEQYTDASNAEQTANAVSGLIPSYTVIDATLQYNWKRYGFSMSVNNLANSMYFTRRADGYPGPGIIPAEPRSIFAGVSARF